MRRVFQPVIHRRSTVYPLTYQLVGSLAGDAARRTGRASRHCEEQRVRPSAGPIINAATKQSGLPQGRWIASRSLSSGAPSRGPSARNDDPYLQPTHSPKRPPLTPPDGARGVVAGRAGDAPAGMRAAAAMVETF